MIRVGLLGPPDRLEIGRLSLRLEERGVEPVLLDSRRPPEFEITAGSVRALGEDLLALRGLMVIDLGLPATGDGTAESVAASRRHLAGWNAALEALEGRVRVVNPPQSHELHGLKPFETLDYQWRGLPVPETVATSSPEGFDRLPAFTHGTIRKSLVGGLDFTEAVEDGPTADRERLLAERGAVLIQRRIVGDNVRVFVLDGRVLGAAAIIPANPAATDSRRGESLVRRVKMPVATEQVVLAAVEASGMVFAAVDLMREGASGRDYLLECNSAPFFVAFEKASGFDIASPLADYLAARRGGTRSEALGPQPRR